MTAPFRFLANISYSLYVIHPIAGYVTMRLLTAAGLPYLAAFAIALAFVIGIASAMHVYVEAPTIALGKRSPKLDLARAAAGGACRRSARSAGLIQLGWSSRNPSRGSPILGPPVANVKRHDKEAAVAVGRSMSRDP